ncbi:MAG TPA: hypothetical protein VE978_21790 [Chitinophagales bacterium]|nr:hypothetical protein [Chitinophagales bacterium]
MIITILIFASAEWAMAGGTASIEGESFLFYIPLAMFVAMLILENIWNVLKPGEAWHRLIDFIGHRLH